VSKPVSLTQPNPDADADSGFGGSCSWILPQVPPIFYPLHSPHVHGYPINLQLPHPTH